MKRLALLFSVILISASFLGGCGSGAEPEKKEQEGKLKVYTTVYPLQYFTEQIGGEFVEAETIYPPGADEHTFEPSQKDMISLADADLFFYVGFGLEGFVDKAKKTLKNEDVKMVPIGESIHLEETADEEEAHGNEDAHSDETGTENNHSDETGTEEDHSGDTETEDSHTGETEGEDGHAHGDVDPHVWLDPVYAQDMAAAVKDQLVAEMPKQKDTFEKNYSQLADQLKTLDQDFNSVFEQAKRKEIIVSHAAYSYWEKRYGLEQISISGLSTTNEPSQKELKKLITHAKQEKIDYVISEQNYDTKLVKMVRDEIGAESLTLHNLSVLTEEDLDNKETYFTLMEKNLSTLKKALNE